MVLAMLEFRPTQLAQDCLRSAKKWFSTEDEVHIIESVQLILSGAGKKTVCFFHSASM